MKRAYRLGKRAESAAATRNRIVLAALELHGSIGPRATTIAEIARMAGVERLTVYHHFADEAALAGAVAAVWQERHPRPAPQTLAATADFGRRLIKGIEALFGWYGRTEPMTRLFEQDAPAMPALAQLVAQNEAYLGDLSQALTGDASLSPWAEAALRAGLRFATWDSLCNRSGLAADEAAALVAAWVRGA